MEPISLIVNGRAVTLTVEARTSLADALREQLNLTGTHLGCEQGVCGACTILIDDKPQRSCIAFAIDCPDSTITTIEGFDADPTMAALREAFSIHHGLQCGFCTPGMLITARDIILRLGNIPESRIRAELAGNLCRCTGYVGIVDAIKSVAANRPAAAPAPPTGIARPAQRAVATQSEPHPANVSPTNATPLIDHRIPISAPPDAVWAALSDLRAVARCLPGAELDSVEGNTVRGHVQIALGPMRARFAGTGTITLNDANREGRLTGQGRDTGGSATSGDVTWQVLPGDAGMTILAVRLAWRLTGPLAQFGRGALVQDLIRRLAADFAANLEAMIAGRAPTTSRPLSLLALLWSLLRRRLLGSKTSG